MKTHHLLLTALCLWIPAVQAQPVVDMAGIAAHVDERVPGALELLERVVNMNSGTMNFEGVVEVGQVFREEFEKLGFETEWIDGSGWGRAGHVVARWQGDGSGPHLLLIGHLDTVFEPDSPFQRYALLDGMMATGPGTTDMKGGNIVMLLALGAAKALGALDHLTVTVVLTGDEEKSGKPLSLARRALLDAAAEADIAIGFEDGDGDPTTAVIARRGSSGWTLRTKGRPAHSSQIFRDDIGSGAIYEAARILNRFHEELREPYLTFNPGMILGGTSLDFDLQANAGEAFGKSNVIAELAVVVGDLRALSLEQYEAAKQTMVEIVAESHPQCSAEIVFRDGYPPLAPTEGNRRLLTMFDQASRDLGFGPVEPVDPARAGAADISFVSGLVEMAMDGVGLMGTGGHTVNETADLETLGIQAKRVAVVLLRLAWYD